MSASYVGIYTTDPVATGTSGVTAYSSSNTAIGDFLLLCVETANEAVTTPSGWTEISGSPISIGTAAAAGGLRLSCYYKFATASGSGSPNTAVISDPGNHISASIVVFRGIDSTTPLNVIQTGTKATASTSGSCPAVTTTTPGCMIANIVGIDYDGASTTFCSSWTNSNLVSIGEKIDETISSGVGGGLGVACGIKTDVGNTGNTTLTFSQSTTNVYMTIALNPVFQSGALSLSIGNTIVVDASVSTPGGTTVSGAVSWNTDCNETISGDVITNATVVEGAVNLTAITSYTGSIIATRSAALTLVASPTINPDAFMIRSGSVTFNAMASETITGERIVLGSVTLNGNATEGTSGYQISSGAVNFTANVSEGVSGYRIVSGVVNLNGLFTEVVSGDFSKDATINLSANATITTSGIRIVNGAVSLSPTMGISPSASVYNIASVNLQGSMDLSTQGTIVKTGLLDLAVGTLITVDGEMVTRFNNNLFFGMNF